MEARDSTSFSDYRRFLSDLWQLDRNLFVQTMIIRFYNALNPIIMLFVAKEFIDQIISVINGKVTLEETSIYFYFGLEIALFTISKFITRYQSMQELHFLAKLTESSNQELIHISDSLPVEVHESDEVLRLLESVRMENRQRITLLPLSLNMIEGILKFSIIFSAMIVFDPLMMALYTLSVAPSFLFDLHSNRARKVMIEEHKLVRRQKDYYLNLSVSENSFREVSTLGLLPELENRFMALSRRQRNDEHRFAKKLLLRGALLELLPTGVFAFFVIQLIDSVLAEAITLGAFTYYLGMLRQTRNTTTLIALRLSQLLSQMVYLPGYFRLRQIAKEQIENASDGEIIDITKGVSIEFDDVWFRYHNNKDWILKSVSFKIDAGERLALVGRNGSGKSTLVKLLLGLYAPQKGRIKINGRDISYLDRKDFHTQVSVLFQDFQRFKLSVEDNVAFGDIHQPYTDEDIDNALALSGSTALVEGLKDGRNQMLGRKFPGGTDLSGGQWQKVCLARFFLKSRASLLILDEPTSAMDVKSAEEVLNNYLKFIEGKTSMLITHHLSSARTLDRILVMKDGELKEDGSFQDLMDAEGLFAELYQLQQEKYNY